jgi:hypothetical protein
MISNEKPDTPENHKQDEVIDVTKRQLMARMKKGVYAAPIALAMMTTKASACSMSC